MIELVGSMRRLMCGFTLAFAAAACTSPDSGAPASTPAGAVTRPVACVAEAQSCDRANRCCDGMICTPTGNRFGDLCRRPMPGGG